MKNIFLISQIIILLYSCNASKKSKIEFGNTSFINTIATSTKTTDIFLGMPIRLEYISNSLIIREPHARTLYKILDLESGLVSEFGEKGRGPNEMVSPISFNDRVQLKFNGYCFDLKKIITYSIDSLKRGINQPNQIINNIDNFSGSIHRIEKAKNNTYLVRAHSFDSSNTYFLLDDLFKTIIQGGKYPDDEKFSRLENLSKSLIFQGNLVYNKEIGKGLLFYSKCKGYEAFEIYNNEIILKKQVLETLPDFKVSEKNPGDVMYSKENKSGFLCSSFTDNYAYALYSGKSYNDTNGNMMDLVHGNKIYKFNWHGELVSIINLDKNINIFTCVNDSEFYGINSKDEPYLLKFSVTE